MKAKAVYEEKKMTLWNYAMNYVENVDPEDGTLNEAKEWEGRFHEYFPLVETKQKFYSRWKEYWSTEVQ